MAIPFMIERLVFIPKIISYIALAGLIIAGIADIPLIKNIKNIKYKWLLALAVLAAFLIRFIYVSAPALYYDENGVVIWTNLFLNGKLGSWAFTMANPPPLLPWITSVSFIIFGAGEFSLRIVEVFFGTLSVLLLYFLAKQWCGKKIAILSAFLLAVMPLHAVYSRLGINSDVIQTFFLLLAIFAMEKCYIGKLNKKKEFLLIILSGIAFGLSFLAKLNSMVLWGIYWGFVIAHSIYSRGENLRESAKRFIISSIAALIVVIASTGFNLSNIFYLLYGFSYLVVAQNTLYASPFYYRLLLLVFSLSPLVFLFFLISTAYLGASAFKTKQRKDIILLSLVLVYALIAILQPRTAARHFLIITPFIAIILSKFIMESNFSAYIIFALMLSSIFWTFSEIKKDIDYQVWNEVISYINENAPKDAAVYSIYPYWPIAINSGDAYYTYRLKRNAVMRPLITPAKSGDIFIAGNFNAAFDISISGPFTGALKIFGKEIYRRKLEPYPKSAEFIKKNAKLIKTFFCDNEKKEECVLLYQIKNINSSLTEEFGDGEKWSIFGGEDAKNRFFSFACGLTAKEPYSKILERLDAGIVSSIEKKCRRTS